MPEPGKNNGVITVAPKPSDYIAGGETGILDVVRNPSGKWQTSEPPGEWQKLEGVVVPNDDGYNTGGPDFLDCVSFSANDTIETLGDFLLASFSPDNQQWLRDNGYFNANGTLNFSDRFLAKVSGTTKDGNSLPNVFQAFKNNGAVPETLWPMPVDAIKADPTHYWEIYYADIPANVLALGQEFLKRFSIQYEWVITPGAYKDLSTIESALQIAPLQIATAVCAGWNTNSPINGCGSGGQHATMLSGASLAGYTILDHYQPFDKLLAPNYDITFAVRGVISEVAPTTPPPFQHVFNTNLSLGMPASDEVHALQQALQILGYMKSGVFGPYGPQTEAAVAAFQKANGITDAPAGAHFGPKTRAKLNSLI